MVPKHDVKAEAAVLVMMTPFLPVLHRQSRERQSAKGSLASFDVPVCLTI